MANEADWVLKTMAAMAAADGRLDACEVNLIQEVFQNQTGRKVGLDGIMTAVQRYASKRDILSELSEVAGSMSSATKDAIIRAAYLTLTANEYVADSERGKLEAIAAALGVSDDQLGAIIEGTSAGEAHPGP